MNNARKNLAYSIKKYLQKADDELEKLLEADGFANPKETVFHINELEEQIAEVLAEQSEEVKKLINNAAENGTEFSEVIEKQLPELLKNDVIQEKLYDIFVNDFSFYIPKISNVYMSQMDSELIVDEISTKTTEWISDWSEELSELMELSSHKKIENVLSRGLKNGKSIDTISRELMSEGIRNEYYKARRAALTETLRAHSVAREEAIQQCPAAEYKEWVHTGSHKNKPRENHAAISGQVVPKNEPFVLVGRDGVTYYPQYPRDTSLPASESVNCHCIHRGFASEKILGLSLEERKRLQQQAIENLNEDYIKSLDEENKRKAGINPDTVKCDWLWNKKTVAERKTYFKSNSRWALFESGVIQTDADLEKLYTYDRNPLTNFLKRRFKTLTELKNDGIMTVSAKTLKHSTVGDFSNLKNPKKPPGGKNGGNMKGGGHSQVNIDLLNAKGYSYNITKTYDNGVRIGNVNEHTAKDKREYNGQSWFPKDWDDDEVLKAGTYIANTVVSDEVKRFGTYNDVRVGIFVDNEGYPTTIFPDADNQP